MRTIIHADNLTDQEDWLDRRDKIDEDTVYRFHLKNGFKPKLKKSETRYVDFRQNEYIVSYRDGELLLYKKLDDSSQLEELSSIKKIMVDM